MTSKEALDKLCDLATQDSTCLNYVIGLAMNIKQELERKTQLEKENQELKEELNSEALDNWQLHCKYGKYKKVIDIFKDKLHIEFDDKYNEINFEVFGSTEIDYVYFSLDDKQEYELLKEMLEDEKY